MAEKQRGFIADNISVTPKRYGIQGDIVKVDLSSISDTSTVKENADQIAYAINHGINWSKTEEGHAFWSAICTKLRRIAREGR